jgi:hypothetical protein
MVSRCRRQPKKWHLARQPGSLGRFTRRTKPVTALRSDACCLIGRVRLGCGAVYDAPTVGGLYRAHVDLEHMNRLLQQPLDVDLAARVELGLA